VGIAQATSSADGRNWQTLAQGQPIFRQPGGASQLHLGLPPGRWQQLRLTVDDQRTQPIPFTGARIHAADAEPVPGEWQSVVVAERHENPGETRLTLNLGAANLDLAAVQMEAADPLFMRSVKLAVPQVTEDSIREQPIGHGTIYRVAIEGQPAAAGLSVPLERRVASRELLVLIENQDSPPLSITSVRVERRPVYLVFLARTAGTHHLLTGNARCVAPRYDLAALHANLKSTPVLPVQFSELSDNPHYRAPDVLAGLGLDGATLDVSAWKYRKAVNLRRAGAQQVELDLDVLAHAQPGFQDLRLLRGSNQVPYVVERTSISRRLTPTVTATNDAKDATLSRWIIRLPQANLPVTRLACVARSALFQRDVTLYEEVTDARGAEYRRPLGHSTWTQTPGRKSQEFVLTFNGPPRSDTLFLETHNGDNPPIELDQFQLAYPATRILFKAKAEDEVRLYYGNPQAAAPRYDLSLVAEQLLGADRTPATLAAAEQLRKSSWAEGRVPGKGGVVFWGVLAVVVAALLVIISRLLPRTK
jgi:hypothetical protein